MALLLVLLVGQGVQIARVDWLIRAIGIVVLITAVGLLMSSKLVSIARQRRLGELLRFKVAQSSRR